MPELKNPKIEVQAEIEITEADIKKLVENKIYAEYSDEATIKIEDCKFEGFLSLE